MTHERFEENVGAYLLSALPDAEREAFERHLETCARCREEVDRLRVAADALPHGVEPLAPPPGLKASLMEVVEREAAGRATADAEAPRPARARRWSLPAWLSGAGLPRLRPATAALGAAALLAIGIGVGYGVGGNGPAGEARTVAGTVAGLPAASASVTVPADGDQAVLRVRGLPATTPDSTYQVWLRRGGRVTSQSLFTVGRDGTGAAAVPDPVDGADAVMVTREPAGGSPQPTARPIVTVAL